MMSSHATIQKLLQNSEVILGEGAVIERLRRMPNISWTNMSSIRP